MKRQYQGDPKLMAVEHQLLWQSYENLLIKNNEGVQDYVTRFSDLVKGLGDAVTEAMVVRKVLRNTGAKFNHIVMAIKESKDITKLTLDELTGS